jgi:hypothetical protein
MIAQSFEKPIALDQFALRKSAYFAALSKDEPTAPGCPHCSALMGHVRALPLLGNLPEI